MANALDDLLFGDTQVADELQDQAANPPLAAEMPAASVIRREKVNRLKAEDLAARDIPSFRNARGDVSAVTDETGAALTHLDPKHGLAYDAAGDPKLISYEGETGPPKLSDPFAHAKEVTDPKSGNVYDVAPGLPWKWKGFDEDVAHEAQQKDIDRAVKSQVGALGRKLSLDEKDLTTLTKQRSSLKQSLVRDVPVLTDPKYEGADRDTVLKGVDEHFNSQYSETDANEKAGWMSSDLSDAAKQRRAEIDAQKANAYDRVHQLFDLSDRGEELRKNVEATRAAESGLNERLIESGRAKLEKLGVTDESTPAEIKSKAKELVGNGVPAVTGDVKVDSAIADARAGNRPYGIGDDDTVQFKPGNLSDGVAQAVKDGVIDQKWADEHKDALKTADDKYNELVATAGDHQKLKALLHGAGIGSAFLAGAVPGAKGGALIGAAIPGAGETGISEGIGAVLGGLGAGTLAAWAARKGLKKLGDYNDAVKSLNAAAELHPVYDAAGEFVAFGASAPKSLSNLYRLGTIAAEQGGTGAAVRIVGRQLGIGALTGATFETAIRPAFDAGVNVASDLLGVKHEDVQKPTIGSVLANAALGVLTAGHSVEFKDYSARDVAGIMVRAKVRQDAGIPLDADNAEAFTKQFTKSAPGADANAAQAMSAPLSPQEISVWTALKTKTEQMQKSGAFDEAGVEFGGAKQARVKTLGREGAPITSAAVEAVPLKPGEGEGGKPAPKEPTGPKQPELLKGGEASASDNRRAQPQNEPGSKSGQERTPAAKRSDETGATTQPVDPNAGREVRAGNEVLKVVAPEGSSPAAPQTDQPHVVSTAVRSGDEILTGARWDEPHDGIGARHGLVEVLPESKGFIVQTGPKGEREFTTDREIAGEVARQAGQAKPEATGALQSEHLQPIPQQPIDAEAHRAATSPQNAHPEPSLAQKEAGNYLKGHPTVGGLPITIENPAGSRRQAAWDPLKSHYGYIKGTKGKDGDHVDAFVRPGTPENWNGPVFVVNQEKGKTGEFDEHKVIIGVHTPEEAVTEYRGNYQAGQWYPRSSDVVEFANPKSFKHWVENARNTKRPAEPPRDPTKTDISRAKKYSTGAMNKFAASLDALGHSREIIEDETESPSGFETRFRNGKAEIVADHETVARNLHNLSPEQQSRWVQDAVNEEIAHVAVSRWKNQKPENRQLVIDLGREQGDDLTNYARTAYAGWDKLNDEQKGDEKVRMILQRRWIGRLTESAYKLLKEFVEFLRTIYDRLNPRQQRMVTEIEEMLGRKEGDKNAITARKKPKGDLGEHQGVPQGGNVPAHEGEIRQENSGQAGGGGGAGKRAPASTRKEPAEVGRETRLDAATDKKLRDAFEGLFAAIPVPERASMKEKAIVTAIKNGDSIDKVARDYAMSSAQIEKVYDKSLRALPAVRSYAAPVSLGNEGGDLFKLSKPESVEEQAARLEREKQSNEQNAIEAAKKDRVKFGWQQKLVGDTGNLGQKDIFGSEELFAAKPIQQRGIPDERYPQFIELARAMVQQDVTTPEALAHELHSRFGDKVYPFTQAVWNLIGAVKPELSGAPPNWGEVYDTLAPAPKPRKLFRKPAPDGGFSEHPMIAAIIDDMGGILSKSAYKEKYGEERYKQNSDLWDDAPALADPRHSKIYNPKSGQTPDAIATELTDMGMLPEGATAPDLWAAIDGISKSSKHQERRDRARAEEERGFDKGAKEFEAQRRSFESEAFEQSPGERALNVSKLQIGDSVTVAGEQMKVIDIDPSTYAVTMEDGTKFGVQTVDDGKVIYVEDVQSSAKLTKGEPSPGIRVEGDRGGTAATERGGEENVSAVRRPTTEGDRDLGEPDWAVEQSPEGGGERPTDLAALDREPSDPALPERESGEGGIETGATGDELFDRSDPVSQQRILVDAEADGSVDTVDPERPSDDAVAQSRERSFRDRVAAQTAAELVDVKLGDLANIEQTLPVLLGAQHDDVFKAEQRLYEQGQKGMLFTNGTGTGKTFSGLGIAKRRVRFGDKNILVVVPTQKKSIDWQYDGRHLRLSLGILKDTQDAGKGISVTTYANFRQNDKLKERDFDLVIYDESHKIVSNEAGSETAAVERHRYITNHPDMVNVKIANRLYGPEPERPQNLNALSETDRDKYKHDIAKYWQRVQIVNAARSGKDLTDEEVMSALDATFAEAGIGKAESERIRAVKLPETKVVFLSATPFAYHKTLNYADGYLFESPSVTPGAGYNVPQGFDAFLVSNFGYRMRYNKLTQPDVGVNVDLMERAFTDNMMKAGSISGRAIDVPYDYSREFILVDAGVGRELDRGLMVLFKWEDRDNHKHWNQLPLLARQLFRYHQIQQLMEAIKTGQAIDRIKQHLDLGRKVILFHTYVNAQVKHPFRQMQSAIDSGDYDIPNPDKAREELVEFQNEYPEIWNLDLGRLTNPLKMIQDEFGGRVRFYNGNVPARRRFENIDLFNDDTSGVDLIMSQMESMKEGVSVHDTSGKHQRVVMNVALPIRPTDAIQTEGRAYRIGVSSNAVYEYVTIHTNAEKFAFGSKINERVRTAENLALGSMARGLEDSFKDGYLSANDEVPSTSQGLGGKERDRELARQISDYERAKTFYFGRLKKTSGNKSIEGIDYYPTPEPLGLKMVQFLKLQPGEKALEPSAGHGAIARFLPTFTDNELVEPSLALANEARIKIEKGDVHMMPFEDYHIVNKFHGIAMNPPYGQSAATAIAHLAKAAKHLNDGGRLVIVYPEGPAADKKFEAWFDGKDGAELVKMAEFGLPPVTFERAGTKIKARMIVIDKMSDPVKRDQMQKNAQSRLEIDAKKIGDLFDRFEMQDVPDRTAPPEKEPEIKPNAELQAGEKPVYKSDEFNHTKTGDKLYVAAPTKFMGDVWKTENSRAKSLGGYWNRYKGGGAIQGFVFKSLEARQKFLDAIPGEQPPAAAAQPPSREAKTTENVSGMARGPKRTPRQAVEAAIKNAGAASRTPLQRAINVASAVGNSLAQFFVGLPAATDYKTLKGEWLGMGRPGQKIGGVPVTGRQKADDEARKMKTEVYRKFTPESQEAINIWREAGGDEAVLRDQLKQLRDAKKTAYVPIWERALKLSPEEKAMADEAGNFFETKASDGQKLGLLNELVDDYVTHYWDRSSMSAPQKVMASARVRGQFAANSLRTVFDNAFHRRFGNNFEGIMDGFKPATLRIGDIMAAYAQSFNHVVADRVFVKTLPSKDAGFAADGRPLATVSGYAKTYEGSTVDDMILVKPFGKTRPRNAKGDPIDVSDYKSINHPALRRHKWAGKDTNGADIILEGEIVVHPEIYQDLKNTLGRSALLDIPGVREITELQFAIKQTLLAMSGFHFVQEGTHAIGHRVNPFNPGKIDWNDALTTELVNNGLMLSGDWNARQEFMEGLAGGGLIEKIPFIGQIQHDLSSYLFEDYIPRLKNEMARDGFQRNLKRYAKDIASGKITRQQIAMKTAKQANDAFGEQNYKYMGSNPTLTHIARTTFLAWDFLRSRANFFADAFTKYGGEQRMALLILAATMLVIAKVTERILTGENHWQPSKIFSVIYKGRQYDLRSVPGDAMEAWGDPRRFIYGRLSPLVSRTAIESVTGRDYRGIKRTPFEQVMDLLKTPVPIPIRAWAERKDLEPIEGAITSAGVRIRRYSPVNEVKRLAAAWNEKIGDAEPAQDTTPSKYLQLKQALEDNDLERAKGEYKTLATKEGSEAVRRGFLASVTRPFSGSNAKEPVFVRSLSQKDKELYARAQVIRGNLIQRFRRISSSEAYTAPKKLAGEVPAFRARTTAPKFAGF